MENYFRLYLFKIFLTRWSDWACCIESGILRLYHPKGLLRGCKILYILDTIPLFFDEEHFFQCFYGPKIYLPWITAITTKDPAECKQHDPKYDHHTLEYNLYNKSNPNQKWKLWKDIWIEVQTKLIFWTVPANPLHLFD